MRFNFEKKMEVNSEKLLKAFYSGKLESNTSSLTVNNIGLFHALVGLLTNVQVLTFVKRSIIL